MKLKFITMLHGVGMDTSSFGNATGNTAANMGMGILSGAIAGQIGNWQQQMQQSRYNTQSMQMQKQMMDYQQAKQLEMWQKTNYGPQVAEMEKAGINPALLYGGGGGGGTTVGGSMVSNSAPQAQNHTMAMMQGAGVAQQQQMTNAQMAVMKSTADLNEAQAENLRTGQTPKAIQETANLAQGLDNMREDWVIKRLQQTMMHIQNHVAGQTIEDSIANIQSNARQAFNTAELLKNEAKVSDATIQEQITIIQKQAIQAALENLQTVAQTQNTQAGTAKTKVETQQLPTQLANQVQAIMQGWDHMSNEQRRVSLQELTYGDQSDPVKHATDQTQALIDFIMLGAKLAPPQGRVPIQGFSNQHKQ